MRKQYELPGDCDYSAVGVNEATRNECNPRLEGGITTEFVGIVINGPEMVVWPKDQNVEGMMVSLMGGLRSNIKTEPKASDTGIRDILAPRYGSSGC